MADPTIKRRGFIVPRDEYSDGSTQWAWPSLLSDPFEAAQTLMSEGGQYRPGDGDAEGVGLAFQAAGGAMAGGSLAARPAASLGAGGILPREVISWLHRAGVPIEKVETASTGSTYVKMRDPNAAKGTPGSKVEVRVPPEDGHGGRLLPKDVKPGNYFDTTPEAPRKQFDSIMAPRVNQGGEQYSNTDALFDVLKWRTSRSPDGQFLVSPDRAPSVTRHAREAPKPSGPVEGPDLTPEQLKLLAGGDPAALFALLGNSPDDPRSRLLQSLQERTR